MQLYEAVGLVLIAVWTSRLPRRHNGAIFVLYLGAYALLRLAMERFRGDDLERGQLVPGLSTSQAIAGATLVAALALFYWLRRPSTPKGAA